MQYFRAHAYSSVLPKAIKNEIQQDRQYMCKVILKSLRATVGRQ